MQKDTERKKRIGESLEPFTVNWEFEPAYLYMDVHYDPTMEEKSVCSRRPGLLHNFSAFEDLVTCNDCLNEMELALLEPCEGRNWVGRDGKVYQGYPRRKTLGDPHYWIDWDNEPKD